MTRLRAATVSNRAPPKKKSRLRRRGSDGEDHRASKVSAEEHVENKSPSETNQDKKTDNPIASQTCPNDSSGSWPEHFKELCNVHRALSIVYTFCCTRKHFATTFDNIKDAVSNHLGRALEINEVTEIKALIPDAVNFAYIDEAALRVAVGEDTVKNLCVGKPEASIADHKAKRDAVITEVLLFEFTDGDLSRHVAHNKTGQPVRPFRKLREEELKMPVFSQKQMLSLIERRVKKFARTVEVYLKQCHDDRIDPCIALDAASLSYIPKPTTAAKDKEAAGIVDTDITSAKERQSIAEVIANLKISEWYTGQIVPDGHRVFEPQQAVFGDLCFGLSQQLVDALYQTRGITRLYSHQADAINCLSQGKHVIVATSTNSGKSLIYQIPMVHALEHDAEARGIYIFPTKALAQDQKRSMLELLMAVPSLKGIHIDTFDGDTAMGARSCIREEARIIFTNPDMLHLNILPQEEKWRGFLKGLKFVVVDELHVYNGLFGSHVALIMRRLRRVCTALGNRHVRFISCSATVANPKMHMQTIFGIDEVSVIEYDGSPSGRKEFVCWNTPYKDPRDPASGRGDTMAETARLLCQLILHGIRVIAFCRVRKQCEILITAFRAEAQRLERPDLVARVTGYRGGYSPQDRRRIEKEMFEGKLMGIIATNALELGIDIGSLDAVVSVGFPYTIANLRQQSGRAGRRNKDSLSVLIGDCFATDQFYMSNPDEIFTKPNCELQVDLTNMLILEGHIQCAAFEMPINIEEDDKFFGAQLKSVAEDRLLKDKAGFYHCNERFRPVPSRCVAIRDTEDGHFAIIDITHGSSLVLEEVEPSRAFFTIYEGGIYLHQGFTYLVKEFKPEERLARVIKVKVDWTTQQRDFTDVDPIETEAIRRLKSSNSRAFYGIIKIRAVVFGFFKIDKRRRILDAVEVDNPPIDIFSKGMWIDVPKSALDILDSRRLNIAAAIHAAEHAILSLMPQFVVSMPGEVRTECKNALKEFATKQTTRKRPARLTFYDAKGGAGGSGISTKAFEFVDLLLERALDRVSACLCLEGCLECCCSESCKEQNLVMSKAGSEVILKCILGRLSEIDVSKLPWGPDDEKTPAGIETTIPATAVKLAPGARIEGQA